MCITMVDLAMGMWKIEEIPTVVSMDKKASTSEVFDETSIQTRRLVHEACLIHYPCPRYVLYDADIEFKTTLCHSMKSFWYWT